MEDSWEMCPYCAKTGFTPGPQDQATTKVSPDLTSLPSAKAGGTRFIGAVGVKKRTAVVGCLIGMSGRDKGDGFWIRDGVNKVGRNGESHVVLSDETVSDHHATIRHHDGKFYLKDNDSTNGTFVSERHDPLMDTYELKDQDTIRFGDAVFKFRAL
jgi:hypothetical protein